MQKLHTVTILLENNQVRLILNKLNFVVLKIHLQNDYLLTHNIAGHSTVTNHRFPW